jgi:hypothetical protein
MVSLNLGIFTISTPAGKTAGETVVFSRIGYQTVEVKIPEKLIADRYTDDK